MAAHGLAWVQDLCAALAVLSLADFGVTAADFPVLVAQAQVASSMKGNPISLTDQEVTEIVRQAL